MFEERLNLIGRKYKFIDQRKLLDTIECPESVYDNLCIITFDDGLKEQMKAFGYLVRRGLSALFFVPTEPLIKGVVLDVHKLHLIRTIKKDEDLVLNAERYFGVCMKDEVDIDQASKQYRYDNPDAQRFKYFLNFVLDAEKRSKWINNIFAETVGDQDKVAQSLYMDKEDIILLAKHEMLGTHAHTHRPLASLDEETIDSEIFESINILKDVCGKKPFGISYPYGGPDAISSIVDTIARKHEIKYGFTMIRSINSRADLKRPCMLNRIDTNDIKLYV